MNPICGVHVQEGFGEFQVTQQKGERADMFRQYLKPVLERSNLQVVTGARTLKVETENSSSGVAAVGVQFSVKGPDGRTHAGAERHLGVVSAPECRNPHLWNAGYIGGLDVVCDSVTNYEFGVVCIDEMQLLFVVEAD